MTDTTYTPPPTTSTASSGLSLPSPTSAALWSSLAGIAAIVCGLLKVDTSWTQWIQGVVVAVGGVLVGIPVHHVVKAQTGSGTAAPPASLK